MINKKKPTLIFIQAILNPEFALFCLHKYIPHLQFGKGYSNILQHPFMILRYKLFCTLANPVFSIVVNLLCFLGFYGLVYQLVINCPEMHKRIEWMDSSCIARVGNVVCEVVTFHSSFHIASNGQPGCEYSPLKAEQLFNRKSSKEHVYSPSHNVTGGLDHFDDEIILLRFVEGTTVFCFNNIEFLCFPILFVDTGKMHCGSLNEECE